MTGWTPCEHYRVALSGKVVCAGSDLVKENAGYLAVNLTIITILLLVLAGFAYLIWQRQHERAMEQAVETARYSSFLELLRDVKWNVLHRNCW